MILVCRETRVMARQEKVPGAIYPIVPFKPIECMEPKSSLDANMDLR